MTAGRHGPHQLLAGGWLCMPTLGGVIGGGLVKLGHGSTAAAVLVAVLPYSICLLLCSIFAIGYLAAARRYLRAEAAEREAMERLIMISADAIVSVLTLNKQARPRSLSSARAAAERLKDAPAAAVPQPRPRRSTYKP